MIIRHTAEQRCMSLKMIMPGPIAVRFQKSLDKKMILKAPGGGVGREKMIAYK